MALLGQAVLRRVHPLGRIPRGPDSTTRHYERVRAFAEEWNVPGERGTARATEEALFVDGIGFPCSACGALFPGLPSLIASSSHSVVALCRACHEPEPRPKPSWPFGRKQ